MDNQSVSLKRLVGKIVLIYAFFVSIWILYSTRILMQTTVDFTFSTQLQIIKSLLFVMLTTWLVHVLVRHGIKLQQENYNFLYAAIEGTADAIFIKDIQGRYLVANSTAANFLGKPAAEIIGQDDSAFFSPEIARQIMENDRAIMATGQSGIFEEIATVNNMTRTYLSTKNAYRDAKGNIIGLIGVSQDITARKQAEKALKESNEILEALIQAAPVSIDILDLEGNVQLWNPAAEKIFGWSFEEIKEQPLPMISEDKQEEFRELFHIVQQEGGFTGFETQRRRKDGRIIDVSLSTAVMRDANGNKLGAMGIIVDITDRKRLEREREELLEQLKKETEDLKALSIVTANSVSTLELEDLLNLLLARIVEVMHADGAVMLLQENNCLCVRASIGIETEMGSNFAIPIGSGFAGIIAATGEPLYVEDAQTDVRAFSPLIKQQGIRSMLGVPLKRDNILVGVLHVDWYSIHPYSDRELHLLEITAERCCMAILNARLYEQTKQSENRYQTLAKVAPVGIFCTDARGKCVYVNQKWTEITGLEREEALEDGWIEALHPEDRERVLVECYETAREKLSFELEYRFQRADGTVAWVIGQAIAEIGETGEFNGYVGAIADITERKQVEEQLRQYAFYDVLTGLPNRTLFLKRLRESIGIRQKSRRTSLGRGDVEPFSRLPLFAVLFLDLERFKIVQYSFGHLVADRLLTDTARRLEARLNPNDMVARIGLDDFAILLANLQDVSDATRIAEQLYQELQLPFTLDGREVFVNANIGIALSSIDYDRAEDFLRAADTAMHACKQQGKAHYAVFDPGWQANAVARLQMETDLRWAIERHELRLVYQPIVSLESERIVGFEALVRWQHPTRGFISPLEFIPLAEETGAIGAIDRWVLREACRQTAFWQQAFPSEVPLIISVNLSGTQLAQLGLIERIDQIVRDTGIQRQSLKLEITESVVMENAAVSVAMLEQLKALGIKLSIDDFGTGYSSLARLHQLPIDTLKIDRSFVSQMSVDRQSLEIVRTIITLTHNLGMDAIAEGIETSEQLAQLKALGCEYGQGYFFSKPIDNNAVWALLRANC